MKAKLIIVALMLVSLVSLAQLERVADKAFANKPFNPGDSGVVMRATLEDADPTNRDPVYLTRINVTNLGTATEQDLAEVRVYLEIGGSTLPLVAGPAFPLSRILISLPPEERMIPDDTQATLIVWVKASDTPTQGHTLKPQVTLGWAEGKKGGTIEITDSAPEKFVVEDSFTGQVLAEPAGGVLNPGDVFPVLKVQVEDTPDVNLTGLKLVEVKVDGPSQLKWVLDNGITKLPLPAGQTVRPEKPLFVAMDEAKGVLTLWAEVPANFSSSQPLLVAPSLTFTLQEGVYQKTLSFADPQADKVVTAGFENLAVNVPQAQLGSVLNSVPDSLTYSVLELGDQDRNATLVELDSLSLVPQGTVNQIATVEITDAGGRLVGYAEDIGQPIKLLTPAGEPLRVPDDGQQKRTLTLTFSGRILLGGSLLLRHDLAVVEENPKNYLVRPDALTKFHGVQRLLPKQVLFFGQPQLKLEQRGTAAVLTTDGETIGLVKGTLTFTHPDLATVTPQGAAPYFLTSSSPEAGTIAFAVNAGPGLARAGDLATFSPALKPVRMPAKEVTIDLSLSVTQVEDWAKIKLPFSLGTTAASFSFTVPLVSFTVDQEHPDTAVVKSDTPLSYLKAYLHFDPNAGIVLKEIATPDSYTARILEEKEPQPGRVLIEIALVKGKEPAAGELARLKFGLPEDSEATSTEGAVKLEILEAKGPAGNDVPFALDPDTASLVVKAEEEAASE